MLLERPLHRPVVCAGHDDVVRVVPDRACDRAGPEAQPANEPESDGASTPVPLRTAWFEGRRVHFFDFAATEGVFPAARDRDALNEALREEMKAQGYDCLIVGGGSNLMSMWGGLVWLTGHMDHRTMAQYVVFPLPQDVASIWLISGIASLMIAGAVFAAIYKPDTAG